MIETLAADEADDVLRADSPRPAIIQAWAPGCGACHQVERVLALLSEHCPRIDFYSLHVLEPDLMQVCLRLQVHEAPTVILWHRGRERGRLQGSCDAGAVWDLVSAAVSGALQGPDAPLR